MRDIPERPPYLMRDIPNESAPVEAAAEGEAGQ
jgi:hypothetical protein